LFFFHSFIASSYFEYTHLFRGKLSNTIKYIGGGKMKKYSILVVDDSPVNIQTLNNYLKREYTVKATMSGPEALKIAYATPPDLILLDVVMPEMDGYEVCRRLKTSPRTRDIPVIFLSAKDQTVDELTGFTAGGADYIAKPFSPLIMSARIKNQLALLESNRKIKDLLSKTLSGSIEILIQCLSEGHGDIFSRCIHMKQIVSALCDELDIPNKWQYEIAAQLSHIGYLCLSEEDDELLSNLSAINHDSEIHENYSSIGAALLKKIPRFETIAEIIENQTRYYGHDPTDVNPKNRKPEILGVQFINILNHIFDLLILGQELEEAFSQLRLQPVKYDLILLKSIEKVTQQFDVDEFKEISSKQQKGSTINSNPNFNYIKLKKLEPGMVLGETIKSKEGKVVMLEDVELTKTNIIFLERMSSKLALVDEIPIKK